MDNKAIVRRLLQEGMNQHNFAVIADLCPNCVYHSPSIGELSGDAHRNFVASILNAFPDIQVSIHEQLAEGDKVITRWTMIGTHQAKFMGIPASGRRIRVTGVCIDRIVNKHIVEEWAEWDSLGLMRQLGLVPEVIVEDIVAA